MNENEWNVPAFDTGQLYSSVYQVSSQIGRHLLSCAWQWMHLVSLSSDWFIALLVLWLTTVIALDFIYLCAFLMNFQESKASMQFALCLSWMSSRNNQREGVYVASSRDQISSCFIRGSTNGRDDLAYVTFSALAISYSSSDRVITLLASAGSRLFAGL